LTYFDTISLGLSDIVLGFFCGLLLFVMIENPFRKIIKILMEKTMSAKKDKIELKVEDNSNATMSSRL